jgi:hypothetical protein
MLTLVVVDKFLRPETIFLRQKSKYLDHPLALIERSFAQRISN